MIFMVALIPAVALFRHCKAVRRKLVEFVIEILFLWRFKVKYVVHKFKYPVTGTLLIVART